MRTLLLALALAGLAAGCRRTDVRDFEIALPEVTAADQEAVKAALAPYGGVERESYVFDAAKHVLRLRYDSMQVAKKNLEIAIARAGFTANGVTPESVGAAPKRASRK